MDSFATYLCKRYHLVTSELGSLLIKDAALTLHWHSETQRNQEGFFWVLFRSFDSELEEDQRV